MLNLIPYHQEQPYTCLPACIRIVLAYYGQEHTETELVKVCESVPVWGTLPERAITGLEHLGYRALWFENASLERLLSLLEQNWPVIVLLRAPDLPHGRAGVHAIVIGGIEQGEVIYIDPALGTEARMALYSFLQAWAALDHQGMVVWIP